MKRFLSLQLLILIVSDLSNCLRQNDDLIAVVQVFRHGQRTPISFYPTDPYTNRSYWPVNLGQLTNEGKRQHYNLGKYTREKYRDFLSTHYSNEDFYAQTTDVDRTHMSALSFLAGLYTPDVNQQWNPNLKWQPIPVHPMDTKLFCGSNCPAYLSEIEELLISDDFFAALNQNYSEVYEILTRNTGINVVNVSQASDIYDILHIEDIFGFKLPEWTAGIYPQPLDRISGYKFQAMAYNDKLKLLSTGFWLHTVIEYFDKISKNASSTQKYQVFSGHDTNIATILETFGIIKPYAPAFASTIYVELRNLNGDLVVNVWHKNGDEEIETVTVTGCDFDCELEHFKTLMKSWTADADTWTAECYPVEDMKEV